MTEGNIQFKKLISRDNTCASFYDRPWYKDYRQVLVYNYLRLEAIRNDSAMVYVSNAKIVKEYKGQLSPKSVRNAINKLIKSGVIRTVPFKVRSTNGYYLEEILPF